MVAWGYGVGLASLYVSAVHDIHVMIDVDFSNTKSAFLSKTAHCLPDVLELSVLALENPLRLLAQWSSNPFPIASLPPAEADL